jgi:alpha-galactosidase
VSRVDNLDINATEINIKSSVSSLLLKGLPYHLDKLLTGFSRKEYNRMKNQINHSDNLEIAYIGGGSRGWAWTFMTDLALEDTLKGTIRLYDVDKEAAQRNVQIGNRISDRKEAVGKWHYQFCETIQEALTGADFVVISILPGTFDEMAVDVHTPEKYGIYQSVGDTAGLGGMIRSLRTVPMFVEFAAAIKEYAPEAWVINYTNPMSVCIKTLYHVFPQIKAFGCCHEVFGTQKLLSRLVMDKFSLSDVKRQDILVNVLGINHFTWFDYASYQGTDLFPLYREFVDLHYETGYDEPDVNWVNSCFACSHRVKFDLFRRYGLIAAAGDRHLAEFMAGEEYLKSPRSVKEWKFELTPVKWRMEDLKARLKRGQRLLNGEEEMDLNCTGEEGIVLIKALSGFARVISNVNIPNTNQQISNLPATAIVETNALFEYNSIRPIVAGKVPKEIKKLIMPHLENHEDIIKAALHCDKELVVKAFLNDPMMSGRGCNETEIRSLVNEMICNTSKYLPKKWIER